MREPFGLRLWEIEKLDPRQVKYIYFHPRDKEGIPVGSAPEMMTEYDWFCMSWKARGAFRDEIAMLWKTHQALVAKRWGGNQHG